MASLTVVLRIRDASRNIALLVLCMRPITLASLTSLKQRARVQITPFVWALEAGITSS